MATDARLQANEYTTAGELRTDGAEGQISRLSVDTRQRKFVVTGVFRLQDDVVAVQFP